MCLCPCCLQYTCVCALGPLLFKLSGTVYGHAHSHSAVPHRLLALTQLAEAVVIVHSDSHTVCGSVGLAQHCWVSISPRPHQIACFPTKPRATHCAQFFPASLALPFLECHRSVVTCCRTFRSGFSHLANHSSASFQLLHVSAVSAVTC